MASGSLATGDNEDDALSLSDLPTISILTGGGAAHAAHHDQDDSSTAFEFGTSADDPPATVLCDADDVFFQGRILPLRRRPSFAIAAAGGVSERRCSSLRFNAGTAIRSSSSSSSCSSSGNMSFFTHSSPSPQLRRAPSKPLMARRRSTGSMPPGWSSFFRLGVSLPPPPPPPFMPKSKKKEKEKKEKKKTIWSSWLFPRGLSCRFADDTVETTMMVTSSPSIVDVDVLLSKMQRSCSRRGIGKDEAEAAAGSVKRGESVSRVIEWLDELSRVPVSTAKAPAVVVVED